MKTKILYLTVFCTLNLILGTFSAAAQKEGGLKLQVTSRLVSIEVLVKDKRTGARVDLLKEEDFKVFDEGRPQGITHFRSPADRDRPLAIILIINTANFTRNDVSLLHDALARALRQLHSEDPVAVITYRGSESHLVEELTGDRERALAALQRVKVQQEEDLQASKHRKGRTKERSKEISDVGFLSAIQTALRHASERHGQARPALIFIDKDLTLLTKRDRDEMLLQLLAADAIVSGLLKVDPGTAWAKEIGSVSNVLPLSKIRTLIISYFSGQTGGETVDVRGDDYSDALEQAIGNIVGSYSLGFVPDETRLDGRLHKLSVRVKVPPELGKERSLAIRTRSGYVAPKVSYSLSNSSQR